MVTVTTLPLVSGAINLPSDMVSKRCETDPDRFPVVPYMVDQADCSVS